MEETYTDMNYCPKCRDFHEATEELGSYRCPGGSRGEKLDMEKLHKELRDAGIPIRATTALKLIPIGRSHNVQDK